MYGGDGLDTLDGGLGLDRMYGGAGIDTFRFTKATDSGVGAGQRDQILDYAAGDIIDLSQIDAKPLDPLPDSFTFINRQAFSNVAGELRFTSSAVRTVIYGDVNGDGVADFEIELSGNHVLTAANFLL